jgi:hypothetical protein
MLQIPNYDVKMEVNDFLMKKLVQSKSSTERQLFLEVAELASHQFSSDYFNRNISHLLFLF